MSEQLMRAGEASIWAQPDGPNTQPQYLGCHEMGDLQDPEGDVTVGYCPDPGRAGGYRVTSSWQGAPGGPPTTSLTTPVGKTADYLERWACPGNLILNKVDCGRRDQFTNRARAFVLYRAYRTGRTYSALASRSPADEGESLLEVPFAAEDVLYAYSLTAARQSIAALGDLNAIAFLDDAQCGGACGPARLPGQHGIAVGDPLAASASALASCYFTADGGATWIAAAADPFAAGVGITAAAVFAVGPGITRYLVAQGIPSPSSEPAVAYSDDGGATWTSIQASDVSGDVILALQALDQYNVFAITAEGYILKSGDGGETWDVQEAGGLTGGNAWNAVSMVSPRIGWVGGEDNVLAVTQNGGVAWTAVAGPVAMAAEDVTAVAALSARAVWVGYDSGNLYFSDDGGVTWHERTFPGAAAGEVVGLAFTHPMIGWMAFNPTAGAARVYRTIDGGYTWEPLALPTTSDANALWAVDENTAFAVGDVESLTGFIGQVYAP